MGAEFVSITPNLPLTGALISSPQLKKSNNGDNDVDTLFSSTTASIETTECASPNECSSYEFGSDSDDDTDYASDDNRTSTTTSKDNLDKGRKRRLSMLSRMPYAENNIVAVVLIPAALVAAYTLFGADTKQESLDIWANFSSVSALVSHLSRQYMAALEEYPILTKALTTAVIQIFGDWAAQRYERKQNQGITTTIHSDKGYDLRRGLSIFADGLFLSGPYMHYCYGWMEDIWPTEGVEGGFIARPLATLCHVFVNDYIFDSISIALSLAFTGVVEGYSIRDVAGIFRQDYAATVKASWLTSIGLIPVEILCFGYLSLSFRVLCMNFVDLLWGAIVSFYSHRSRRENSEKRPEDASTSNTERR